MKKRYILTAVLIMGMVILSACHGIEDPRDEASLPSYTPVTDDSKDSSQEGGGDNGGNGSAGVVYQWEEQAEDPVTAKWLKEQYRFTDDDLKGIDVEKVAWGLWWTRESVVDEYGDDGQRLLNDMRLTQERLEGSTLAQGDGADESVWAGRSPQSMPDFDTLTKNTYKATGSYYICNGTRVNKSRNQLL